LKAQEILPVAYTPLAKGPHDKRASENLWQNSTIKALAQKYSKTETQIILGWGIARGYAVIPKSSDFER